MQKQIWTIAGTISLGLGIVGIFVPILPTTPFLLLAAFFYGRGSQRFHDWLVYRSRFSGYIYNYRAGLGIPLKQKVLTIALLWLTIGFSVVFVTDNWWIRALLVIVAAGVTTHLARIKVQRPDPGAGVPAPKPAQPAQEP